MLPCVELNFRAKQIYKLYCVSSGGAEIVKLSSCEPNQSDGELVIVMSRCGIKFFPIELALNQIR
jgi:hypothetical protein